MNQEINIGKARMPMQIGKKSGCNNKRVGMMTSADGHEMLLRVHGMSNTAEKAEPKILTAEEMMWMAKDKQVLMAETKEED